MKNSVLLLIAGLLIFLISRAQVNRSVFFELGGNGVFFSVNYDARFTKEENGLGIRAGLGFIPGINIGSDGSSLLSTSTILTIPLGLNYLLGKAPNYFEAGLGATFISGSISILNSESEKGSGVIFVPSAGYRYAQLGKAFQGRIIIAPFIGQGGLELYGGLSAGFKF